MKIVFFAPHSALWVHAFPEALVAEALQQAGHEVTYIACGRGLQDQCVPMSAASLDYRSTLEQRQRVCKQCDAHKVMLRQRLELQGYDLVDVLEPQDRREIEAILAAASPKNFLAIEIGGVPVGRYALYELLLHHKKLELTLDDNEWLEYRAALKGALTAAFAGRRILEREKPDRVFAYNALYAVNHVFCALARRYGAEQYFLHAGGNLAGRLQTLMLGTDITFSYVKRLVAEWPRFRDKPCPPGLMKQITEHFIVLFRGQSVFGYSAATAPGAVDVRQVFGIKSGQRVLIAAMSSPDERFAAESVGALEPSRGLLFTQQVDWIRALLRFVKTREDLFLIIRVHPREFPNKREQVKSQHATLLEEEFSALPANARVNWPSDQISLYQLANEADVFLNAWSSAGKEMALLGLPVVAYSQDLIFYPLDLNYTGATEAEYFSAIERALCDGWNIERSRMTYRWLALEYGYGLVDIRDSYKQTEQRSAGFYARAKRRLLQIADPSSTQRSDCRSRAPALASKGLIDQIVRYGATTPVDTVLSRDFPESTTESEDRMLRIELARLGSVLFGNSAAVETHSLAANLARLVDHARAA